MHSFSKKNWWDPIAKDLHACYSKPDPTSTTEGDLGIRGNLLLNGHADKLSSKHLCLYT